jgi:hypothetical protein
MPSPTDRSPNTDEMEAVERRILDVQARRRDRIRWQMGKHTAEMAIAAMQSTGEYRRSGKCRSRKRKKRLL